LRLLARLRRWHRLDPEAKHFVEFNGKPVNSVKTAFKSAVRLAGLGPGISPHTLRPIMVMHVSQFRSVRNSRAALNMECSSWTRLRLLTGVPALEKETLTIDGGGAAANTAKQETS